MKQTARVGLRSALVYVGLSLTAAGAFLLATSLTGDHNWVARGGGAAWVFLLCMIVLMPVVIPWMKGRSKETAPSKE